MKFWKLSLSLATLLLFFSNVSCNAAQGDKFKLVNDVKELKDGDLIIIARYQDNTVMSTVLNNKKRKAKLIKINNGIAQATDETEVIRLDAVNKSKADNSYYLYATSVNKYICNGNTGSYNSRMEFLGKNESKFSKYAATAKISISKDIDNTAIIYYAKNSSSNLEECWLRYTRANGVTNPEEGHYSCYTTENFNREPLCRVQIYKKLESAEDVALDESNDNASAITSKANVNVSLTRTLVKDKWNTFCVPFDIALDNGRLNGVDVRVMEYGSEEGDVMFFVQNTEKIKAGKPYLIKPSADIVNPEFKGVDMVGEQPEAVGDSKYKFQGVYSPKMFSEDESKVSLFVNGNAEFKRPKAGTSMKGMRAYFICASETIANARLNLDGKETGISEIVSDVDDNRNIYNLNGYCVGTCSELLAPGLYVKNGKKIIVRQ